MIKLDTRLDLSDFVRFRTLAKASRTMAAKSLTFVAEKAQAAWRIENSRVFRLRRRWLQSGVRIKHATAHNLESQVGSIDTYFGRHVRGIDEPKRAGGKRLFVPVQPVEEQGTHTQILRAIRRMRSTKTKPFMQNGKLLRRLRKGHDAPLKVLAVLRNEVSIPPRFDAKGITERAVRHHYPTIYERLLDKWSESGRS